MRRAAAVPGASQRQLQPSRGASGCCCGRCSSTATHNPRPNTTNSENLDRGHKVQSGASIYLPDPHPQGWTLGTSAPARHCCLSSPLRDAAVPKQSPGETGGTDRGGHRQDRKSHITITPLKQWGHSSTLPRVQGFSSFPAVLHSHSSNSPAHGIGGCRIHPTAQQLCPVLLDLLLHCRLCRLFRFGTSALHHMPVGCSAPGLNLPSLHKGDEHRPL